MKETMITNVSQAVRDTDLHHSRFVSITSTRLSVLSCDDPTFQPCSPRVLFSLKVVGDYSRHSSRSAKISLICCHHSTAFSPRISSSEATYVDRVLIPHLVMHDLKIHNSSPGHNSLRPITLLSNSMMRLSCGTLLGALVSRKSTSNSGGNLIAR